MPRRSPAILRFQILKHLIGVKENVDEHVLILE